jgi:hypothetical protein
MHGLWSGSLEGHRSLISSNFVPTARVQLSSPSSPVFTSLLLVRKLLGLLPENADDL